MHCWPGGWGFGSWSPLTDCDMQFEMAQKLKRSESSVSWKRSDLRKRGVLLSKWPNKTLGDYQDNTKSSFRVNKPKSLWKKIKEMFKQ